MSKERTYVITGQISFQIDIEAASEDEADLKFDKLSIEEIAKNQTDMEVWSIEPKEEDKAKA